jgi:hypothetical protein
MFSAGPETDLPLSTDIESLRQAVDPGFEHLREEPAARPAAKTDFESLGGKRIGRVAPTPVRTMTDVFIDGLTPLMIFIMVYAVLFFLLDVRYVYTEVNDTSLRFVAFCFIMGVVALNRLIAREGSQESVIYMIGLAMAIGFYTISTTGAYDMGSVTRNFMNSNPVLATAFNMCIVLFIWWLVNRLTHECCVDENRSAGDVGILTGAARKWQTALQKDAGPARPRERLRSIEEEIAAPMYVLEPYDPREGFMPKPREIRPVGNVRLSDRLAGRHPGMSIFYFSVPVMFAFAVGLRVIQHGGDQMVMAGKFYMGVYTVAALMLLMLTSLGGLREYFRTRRIAMPDGIGWFWMGLGTVMIAVVLVGATQLPMPSLPPIAYVDAHQTDFWTRGSTFELSPVAAAPMALLEQSRFMDRVGQGVLAVLGLFLLYSAMKGLGALAARIARRRDRYPRFVVRFFDGLDRLLMHLTRWPTLPERKRRIRIQRSIATSARYANSMRNADPSKPMTTRDHVEYAYEALCALAYDLGTPRQTDQTPFEFIASFPESLETLREEAQELTRLYVMAAYSPIEMSQQLEDRLRKFWIVYTRVRNRVVR